MVVPLTAGYRRPVGVAGGVGVKLTADDGVYPIFTAREIELESPKHVTVVGNCEVLHPKLFGLSNIALNRSCPVEQ